MKPKIDPQVDKILRQMSDKMAGTKIFKVELDDTFDEVLESGQKIEVSHHRTAIVSRPNKLRVDVEGDIFNRSIWKDDKKFTMLDKDENCFDPQTR